MMKNSFIKSRRGLLGLFTLLGLHAALWWFALSFPAENIPLLLHYRVNSGADLIGFRDTLLAVPLTGAVVLAANILLALLLEKRDRMLLVLTLLVAGSTQVFLFLGLLALYLINRA